MLKPNGYEPFDLGPIKPNGSRTGLAPLRATRKIASKNCAGCGGLKIIKVGVRTRAFAPRQRLLFLYQFFALVSRGLRSVFFRILLEFWSSFGDILAHFLSKSVDPFLFHFSHALSMDSNTFLQPSILENHGFIAVKR
jgi:hypothetical protein